MPDTAAELIKSTSDRDYWSAQIRNDDLTTLARAIGDVVSVMGICEGSATIIKESIVCAYLLGRRDAVEIPKAFKDL